MSGKPTKSVLEMSRLRIVGNVTPNTWYELIRFPATPKYQKGKPDPLAVLILSEICYWYRLSDDLRDLKTTKSLPPQKRFLSDKWQTNYQQLADKFGFSKTQVKDALYRLSDSQLITMEFRTIRLPTTTLNNVLFVEPIVKNIEKITFYDFDSVKNQSVTNTPPPVNHPLPPMKGERVPPMKGERVPPMKGERVPPIIGETNTISSTTTSTQINSKENLSNDTKQKNIIPSAVVAEGADVMRPSDAKALFSSIVEQSKARSRVKPKSEAA